ncbi:MAG: PrsW family glutamic-type intramembrane protease [bacterium]|nr:PrsW family glutamic-type intramembrane protease [bacterium]
MDFQILGIILGFLPGLTWLFFYLKEDPHPEPKYLIFITFISGIIAALLSFFIQYFLNNFFEKNNLALTQTSSLLNIILIFLVFAFIEEFMKFFITLLTVSKNKNFDEPVDAMIYIIINALGFATLENIGVLTNNQIIKNSSLIMIQTLSLRFVGATLLHTLTSGFIGYFWAISIREFNYKKPLILGLFLATILHTIFNFFIISYGSSLIIFLILLIAGLFILIDFEKLRYKKI